MADGFKASLANANKLMWAAITIALTILLLDPNAERVTVLGVGVDRARLIFVAPVTLAGLLLARQVVIRNAVAIVRSAEDKKPLREIVGSYPLAEFMRWRFDASAETVALTIFQTGSDLLPPVAIAIFLSTAVRSLSLTIATSILLVLISVWNYRSLRRGVYEPLLGPIKTPD